MLSRGAQQAFTCRQPARRQEPRLTSPNLGKSVKRSVVRGGKRVEVPLCCGDARVAQAFLDDLQVSAAGEEPRCMSVAKVVNAHVSDYICHRARRDADVTPTWAPSAA